MRHSAIFRLQPHVHDSSRINLNAASLRAPLIPCQSTPGYSGAVCHDSWARQRTPSNNKGAKLRILTFLLSLNGSAGDQIAGDPAADLPLLFLRSPRQVVPLVILSPALWILWAV